MILHLCDMYDRLRCVTCVTGCGNWSCTCVTWEREHDTQHLAINLCTLAVMDLAPVWHDNVWVTLSMCEWLYQSKGCGNWSCTCVTWLVYTSAMTHPHICHDSFIHVTWLIDTRAVPHWHIGLDLFIHAPWLIDMCAMTHSYTYHDSFIYVPWLIHTCVTTHSYMCQQAFLHVACLIDSFDYTHIAVCCVGRVLRCCSNYKSSTHWLISLHAHSSVLCWEGLKVLR